MTTRVPTPLWSIIFDTSHVWSRARLSGCGCTLCSLAVRVDVSHVPLAPSDAGASMQSCTRCTHTHTHDTHLHRLRGVTSPTCCSMGHLALEKKRASCVCELRHLMRQRASNVQRTPFLTACKPRISTFYLTLTLTHTPPLTHHCDISRLRELFGPGVEKMKIDHSTYETPSGKKVRSCDALHKRAR
jgi:hypothetical protein